MDAPNTTEDTLDEQLEGSNSTAISEVNDTPDSEHVKDVFNMSDEEFEEWNPSSENLLQQPPADSDEDDDDDTEDDYDEDSYESASDEHEVDESDSDTTIDYKSEFSRLVGSPIKANGKEIIVDNTDDAIRLMQMGMNYSKKMEELKPAQRIIAMLENHDLLDEEKLNFAIDLLVNKNPDAIAKLVSDSEVDLYDLGDGNDYKPNDYRISEEDLALDLAIKDIKDSPTYSRTITVVGKQWDEHSRNIVRKNPQLLGVINQHMADGTFDSVMQEVEKRKMIGAIPQGISDIETYKLVGDSLYAVPQGNATPNNGQLQNPRNANVNPPIRKPNRETVVRQKKAAGVTRGKSSVTKQMEDVFSMSDDDFLKRYGGNY